MTTDAFVLEQYALGRDRGRWERMYRGLTSFIRHKPIGAFGGFFVILLLAMALFPALFASQNPDTSDIPNRLQGPSAAHWFGTDRPGATSTAASSTAPAPRS
jgi:ABC-type dipeptide/oligopeptide/nickel transport system permease subunit